MNKSIVKGSISDITAKDNIDVAEAFLNVDAVLICDISGSMLAQDSRGGKSRWQVAGEELAQLQESLPGKLAIIAFANSSEFVPSGALPEIGTLGHDTNLSGALKFAKTLDVPGIKFIVISDGQPNDPDACIMLARSFQNHIDVIFVGPENDIAGGRAFLQKLARASGGQFATAARVKELGATTRLMLEASA